MNKRVLLSCPVSNRAWIIPHYLKHIYNVQYDKKLIDIYWIINNSKDTSFSLLSEFQNKYKNEYNSIKIDIYNNSKIPEDKRTNQIRQNYTYSWLSELRNKIFKKCVDLNCDFLFSCDCDILVSKNILNNLASANKEICASLIWNGYMYSGFDNAYKFPNVLKYENNTYKHIVNYYVKNPDKSPKDKICECDATGACILINKEVCKNTYYKYHILGEDLGWSDVCREKGYSMYFLPSCFSKHVMDESLLGEFVNYP